MRRRFLISFDGTLTGIENDLPDASRLASSTLALEGGGAATVMDAYDGRKGAFAALYGVEAYPTRLIALTHAARCTGLDSLQVSVHDLDVDRAKARLVATTDLIQDIDPAYEIFGTVETALRRPDGLEPLLERLTWRFEYIADTFGDGHRYASASEVLAELRNAQDAFGPEAGSPYRIVPDPVEGEDPHAVLRSLEDLAVARVREIVAKVEARRSYRAGMADSPAIRDFVRIIGEAVQKRLRFVFISTDDSFRTGSIGSHPLSYMPVTDKGECAAMISAVKAYLDVPEAFDDEGVPFRHPGMHEALASARVSFTSGPGGVTMSVGLKRVSEM